MKLSWKRPDFEKTKPAPRRRDSNIIFAPENHVAEVHEGNKHKNQSLTTKQENNVDNKQLPYKIGCNFCNKKFGTEKQMLIHEHFFDGLPNWKCKECKYKSCSPLRMNIHKKNKHSSARIDENQQPEKQMQKKSVHESEKHLKHVHDKKKFMSPKRDSDSSRNDKVTLEQIFRCSICNHNLSSFHNLEVHAMICHEYKCPEC